LNNCSSRDIVSIIRGVADVVRYRGTCEGTARAMELAANTQLTTTVLTARPKRLIVFPDTFFMMPFSADASRSRNQRLKTLCRMTAVSGVVPTARVVTR